MLNMPDFKKLSIIIVNYQSEKHLKKCIDALYAKIKPIINLEIIVVNNDASESLEKIINVFPKIKVLTCPKNYGFGSAANKGASIATSNVFLFLNPDTEIINNRIDLLLKEFENNPRVGVIGPKIIDQDGYIQKYCFGKEPTFWEILKNNLNFLKSKTKITNVQKKNVDWVSGAALFIRKSVFEKLNGFDKNFFLYFEDVDLCRRARLSGWKILYFPNLIVRHLSGKSFSNKRIQKKHFYASQFKYFLKHHGQLQAKLIDFLRRLTHNLEK